MSYNYSLKIFTVRCKHTPVCTSMCSSITILLDLRSGKVHIIGINHLKFQQLTVLFFIVRRRISEFLFLISLLIGCHQSNNFNHHSMLSTDL
ncbi:hypothetical protein EUGRSUZ_H03026 [Eucalyptus grandis]|uniref:Uncharacterized protein n=2 Tax=Eucalyptus grandis TaxID=71139 RepID=A0ACC3JU97_EUCGR|nr:hypothetical protein EUGRSUZ_H03026 [Eucalyptus grandis]